MYLFQTLVGRLIGRKGAFVNKIKATTDATLIVYPHKNRRLKLCSVEGKLRFFCVFRGVGVVTCEMMLLHCGFYLSCNEFNFYLILLFDSLVYYY